MDSQILVIILIQLVGFDQFNKSIGKFDIRRFYLLYFLKLFVIEGLYFSYRIRVRRYRDWMLILSIL